MHVAKNNMSIAWEEKSSETQQFSADPIVNDKIKLAVVGLWQPSIQNLFLEFPTDRDKELVADFIVDCVNKENIRTGTRRAYLVALARLCTHVKQYKSLEAITAKDLSAYLDSIKPKDAETKDPDQSWISTQRAYGLPLVKFFKWLAYPDATPQERRYLERDRLPPVLRGIVLQTKKGSKSPIKAKDIWNDEDTAVFLRHCKDNSRLRFYHALAIETSGRPGELLQLKIGDIQIQTDAEGKPYAALDIGRHGKKKQSRIVGITEFTLQYYQKYLCSTHPDSTNKNAFIFISREPSAQYCNVAISGDALRADYIAFRNKVIPKLLKSPDVSEQDKKHLELLRDQKKWNPYTMRHSSITKLARHPNVNDYVLRQHCGWSKRSDMVEVYTHELKGDSLEHVMMAYGINIKDKRNKSAHQLHEKLVGPHCPFCHTINIPDTQFCVSCGRPISLVSYDHVAKELEQIKTRQMVFENILRKMVASDLDIDINDPEEQGKIAQTLEKVLANKWNLFDGE
jgi:integrase